MALIYHFSSATPNIGNDLINLATHNLIEEVSGQTIDILNMPAKGTTSVVKRGGLMRDTIYDINQLGARVLVGPGNLFESNGLDVDSVALEALKSTLLLFSVSAGRIFDDDGQLNARSDTMPAANIRALCAKASGILVRDRHTREYLEQLGITGSTVVGCPVLALRPDSLNLPPVDPRAANAVLISLRHPLVMNVTPRLQGRVHFDVRRLIDGLRAQGHNKIALLCHDPRDIRFAAGYPDIPYLYTEDPLRYLAWLRDCALNVGYRVHSLLPCAMLGTPSVHLTYDERAQGLVETAGLGGCAIDYINDPDPVITALAMCANTDQLIQTMAIARVTWAPLRHSMLEHVQQWLELTRR